MATANVTTHLPGASVPAPRPSGPLTGWEIGWAMAAFAGLFPRGAHDAIVGIEELDVVAPLQALVRAAPVRARWGIRVAILLAALAPIFLLGQLRSLVRVDSAAKTMVMGRLLASEIYPVRQLALLLKMIGSFLLAREPRVRDAMMGTHQVPVPAESGTRLIGEAELVRRARAANEDAANEDGDARRIA